MIIVGWLLSERVTIIRDSIPLGDDILPVHSLEVSMLWLLLVVKCYKYNISYKLYSICEWGAGENVPKVK